MNFILGGLRITNARNVEFEENEDGSIQLWFDTLISDEDGKTVNVRFHIFKLRFDPEIIMSLESFDGKLYEVLYKDDEF